MKAYLKLVVFFLFLVISCSRRAEQQSIPLLIGTWNLEHFPQAGDTTINKVIELVREYQFDIVAIQELLSVSGFNRLLDSLPCYDGIYASNGFPKTAFIYKKAAVTVEESYQLELSIEPREPLVAKMETAGGLDFIIINVHLKAEESGVADDSLRGEALELLKHYIDSLVENSPEGDFIVLGDWNDLLDDPADENIFLPFLGDSENYRFLTEEFARRCPEYPSDCSCVGAQDTSDWSFYDHILISKGLFDSYIANSIEILCIDETDPTYIEYISNHRPVVAEFDVN